MSRWNLVGQAFRPAAGLPPGAALLVLLISASAFAAPHCEVADAAMQRNADAVRALLEKKADANAPQADGATALHWAAHWDDLQMAALLIRAGAQVQAPNGDGATPLFLATENGSTAMIETLLRAGADANAPVLSHGETPLMMAARSGHADAVKVLLDHGARLNVQDSLRGTTALMWAAEQGHAAVVQLLADRGADLRIQSLTLTPPGRRGLGYANSNVIFGASGRASAKETSKGGLTALLMAVREGSLDCVRILVAKGAGVNQTAVDGSAPLLVAVQNGHYDIARFLLDHEADPKQSNAKGWTPLYLAVKNRNQESTAIPGPSTDGVLDCITALLDRGADPNARLQADTEVHQGMSALWLREAGATPLLRAALSGDLTLIRLLLARHADPQISTLDHTTPLMVAAGVGWAEGMMHEYSEEETLQVVKLLLDSGADVNAANDHGITALHGAAYKGADKVVQLLVDRGAKLDATDNGEDYGFGARTVKMTPLNWAEGVPIGMASAIYHRETVALLTRLMQERGIPIQTNAQAMK
jgi:ankyrin repeat protein